jgi:hypothetical protein
MMKILQYQEYMRQYMIDAQEQKYRAVQEAQAAAQKKLSESLSLLGLVPATDLTGATATSSSVAESPLYTARNVAVSKAGSQSRWGPMEVQRASDSASANSVPVTKINGASLSTATTMSVNGAVSVPTMTTVVSTPITVPVPPEVAEADHGLRSDGSIGGLTLAERIYFGATAAPATTASSTSPTMTTRTTTTVSPTTNPMEVLYQKRNIKVVQAAKAGRSSRWGDQEVERVSNIVAATMGQIPNANTAVLSVQPAQRVNFGATILGQQ